MALRWKEFLAQKFPTTLFLVNPYVPIGAIILLYGKTRVGKSPLTWELARAIASGTPFFGRPTIPARVLYLELDTPAPLVQHRVQLVTDPPDDVWWEFLPPCHIVTDRGVQAHLRELGKQIEPGCVIFNTLRKIHQGDEKDGSLPSRLYQTLHALFPGAAKVLVHHDKKSQPREAQGDPDETFSGHMAWLNDAQVGLHLVPNGRRQSGALRLENTKNQCAEEVPPLHLFLSKDGSTMIPYVSENARRILETWYTIDSAVGKSSRVKAVSQVTGLSERTVWTHISRLPEEPVKVLQD